MPRPSGRQSLPAAGRAGAVRVVSTRARCGRGHEPGHRPMPCLPRLLDYGRETGGQVGTSGPQWLPCVHTQSTLLPGRGAPMLTAQSRAARTRPEAKCPRGVTGNTLHSPLSEAGKIGDVLTHETVKWTCFSVVGVDPPGGRPAPPRGRGAPDGHTHGAFRGQRPHQQRQTPAEHYRSRPVVAKAPCAWGVG